MQVAPEIAALVGEIDFDPDQSRAKYLAERDKRLRGDGIAQYVEMTADCSHYVDDPYVDPGFTRNPVFDHVQFAIIGAGVGGLLMGARLRELGHRDLRVVEVAGVVVLLPAAARRTRLHAEAQVFVCAEILEHSRRIARHYNLYDNALLQTANHVAYIVAESQARGHRSVEATHEAELAYVNEVHGLARLGQRFYEGAKGNKQGFFSDMYGAGPLIFFQKLAAWRDDGRLEGLELR